ncbi:ABC transporter permease [Pelosinus baikalensis]|uniref:ABC transporter permease n=1 Tax=Pelosinus baikalensis TaxID=2892015 RepID=A0ABS8HRH1_9FIRM|nr:ABC transporter permease [Pelosinus baikalensis]MCC5465670.1 ABC transporter permease [Pelosinus baikalensis]
MLRIIKTEFLKLKRYSVIWIGIAATLSVVLLSRFMAMATDGTTHTFHNFSNTVIWNNFSLIFPATIALISGYMIERERTDDTLKNILTIPLSFRRLLAGKLITVGLLSIFLAVMQFLFTLLIVLFSHYPGLTIGGMVQSLFQMIGMNIFVYIAVMPVVIFTGQRAGSFMSGVGFTFFYGFVGVFASGHGLTNLYPIVAGLGIINYQEDGGSVYNQPICFIVILLMIVLSFVLLLNAHDRVKTLKYKDKPVKQVRRA